jgi:hypothetical protein
MVVSYADVLYGKSLVNYYSLKCSNGFETQLPVVNGRTNHTFSLLYTGEIMKYCILSSVSREGVNGPESALVFVSK